ncbi:PAS domain S-box protein [Lutibacter flavus]|uniref:histidine kinase n=1 Tax=Lutibacter flavus TaxID=691689 RepID=A0A238XDJ3_9FLAO|nr:PAS domain S-box protein [Lutibacter flavus]SNR56631.1 PAS domain S-box-containing protein [Lutibacter flavus]
MQKIKKTIEFFAQKKGLSNDVSYLNFLVDFLGKITEIDNVIIGVFKNNNPTIVKTLAIYAKGDIIPNFEYELKSTPCENVMGKSLCVYKKDIQNLFPKDKLLVDLNVESYIGIPLWDSSGNALGIISLLDSKPMEDSEPFELILQIAASNTSREIEKLILKKEAKNLYKEFFNSSPDILYRTDLNGVVTFISPSAERITGYTIEETIGINIADKIYKYPEEKKRFLKKLSSKGFVSNFINQLVKKDGTTFWGSVNSHYLKNKTGDIIGIEGIVRDISDLKEKELLFNTLSEATFEGICIHENGFIIDLNERFAELFGYSKKELKGKNVLSLAAPDGKALVSKLINSKNQGIYEAIGLRKDGSTFCAEVRGKELVLNDKNLRVAVLRDVTGQKRMAKQLKNNEEKLELFFSQSFLGFYIMELDTPIYWNDTVNKETTLDYIFNHQKITKLNDAYLKHYGANRNEFIGKTLASFYKENLVSGKSQWKQFLDKGHAKVDTIEYRLDGTQIHIEGDYTLMHDAQGRITGHFGVQRDITNQLKNLELLKESEKSFRKLIASAPDAFFRGDSNGNLISVNEKSSKLTGYTTKELLKMNMKDLFSSNQLNKKPLKYNELNEGDTIISDRELLCKNGNRITVEMNSSKMDDGNYISFFRDLTERNKKDHELLKLSSAVNQNSAIIQITDNKGNIEYVNSKFIETTGFILNDVIGTKPYVISDGNTKIENALIWKVLNDGETWKGEVKSIKKNGEYFYTSTSISPLFDNNKKISNFLISQEDITESRKAREELKKSEQVYQVLIDKIPDGVYKSTDEGKFISVNPAMVKMLGYSSMEELLAIDIKKDLYFDLDDRENFDLDEANKELGIFRIKKKDGSELWVEDHGWYTHSVSGKKLYHEGIMRDITDRIKLEKETLLKKERVIRLKNTISRITLEDVISLDNQSLSFKKLTKEAAIATEISQVGIWLFSEDKKVLNCVSQYDRTKNKHNIGMEILRKDFPNYFKTLLEKSNVNAFDAQNDAQTIEFKDNYLIPNNIMSLYDKGILIEGELKGVVCFENVGKKVSWEADQDSFANTIAAIVSQTIVNEKRRQTEKKLIIAIDKAEESDRLKSAFLANMSHEIRTPMNGILGFTNLLKQPELTGEKQKKYIEVIEKSGERMLNIINDIISISKVESGQMEVSLSKTNINKVTEYIHTFFYPEATKKGIELILHNSLKDKEAFINTDKEKIYAILTNLVKNALKFTSKGKIEIGYERKNNSFQFYVKDTGVGIPKEQQKIIFERFRQGSEALTRDYEGAGLGLAISKGFVELLGGKLWVESELNKGTVFYFEILDSENCEVSNEISKQETIEILEGSKSKIKILVVEDDEMSSMLLEIILKDIAEEILVVRNGLDAVEICKTNPDIDLILIDIQLPIMDGLTATKKIRKFNKRVNIIAQTAFGMSDDKDKALEVGCDYFMPKPINKNKLLKLVSQIF